MAFVEKGAARRLSCLWSNTPAGVRDVVWDGNIWVVKQRVQVEVTNGSHMGIAIAELPQNRTAVNYPPPSRT